MMQSGGNGGPSEKRSQGLGTDGSSAGTECVKFWESGQMCLIVLRGVKNWIRMKPRYIPTASVANHRA